jgi:hypothetical protein
MRTLLTALAMALSIAPARAEEPLDRLLAHLPPQPPQHGYVFGYVGPGDGFAADIDSYLVAADVDTDLRMALRNPDPASKLTGIDFARIDGVLQQGDPPDVTVFLSGAPGFAEGAAAAFAARGARTLSIAGRDVLAIGDEEKNWGLDAVPIDDPFGRGLRGGHRVASGKDLAVVTPDTPLMVEVLARGTACPQCKSFVAMAEAARKARGGAGREIVANGFTVAAHITSVDLSGFFTQSLDEAKAKLEAGMAAPRTPLPPFLLSLLLASRSPAGEAAQIALLYTDRASAGIAAPEFARRLEAFLPDREREKPATRGVTYADGPDGSVIAVLTLAYPQGAVRAGLMEHTLWMEALYQRQFKVLDPSH